MTRFTLLAFALFTSACAADIDTNVEDTTDQFRASLEDIDTDTERSSTRRNQRLVRAVMSEYGPLAKQYDCDIVGVVSASWTDLSAIKGAVLDFRGRTTAGLTASMRRSTGNAGAIIGRTHKSHLKHNNYQQNGWDEGFLRGSFEGRAIEGDVIAVSEDGNIEDLEFFADWSRKGSGGTMKGVIADCD